MGNSQNPPNNVTMKQHLRQWGFINTVECRVCRGDFDETKTPQTRFVVYMLIKAQYDNFCNEGFHCDDPEHARIFHVLEERKHNCCEIPDQVFETLVKELNKHLQLEEAQKSQRGSGPSE